MSEHPPSTRSQISERDAAIRIIDALRDAGFIAYLAGGCVRDQLLGVVPKDYDVATSAHPEDIERLFAKTAAVGAAFGVMLVRDFGPTIEVATFRSDGPYSDARRPDHVEFSNPEMDAQRRDFTINALFLSPTEAGDEIIDFVNGQSDIDAKILRAVGDPEDRLREDHLRALRAVRFAARYDLTIDDRTANAIRTHASELSGVSVERVGDEVRRMMDHPSRATAAELVQQLTLDSAIFGDHSEASPTILQNLDPSADAMTALAAWSCDRAGMSVLNWKASRALHWSSKLDLSNTLGEQLGATHEIAGLLLTTWNDLRIARRKRLASRQHFRESLLLVAAIDPVVASSISGDIETLSSDGIGLLPEPLINGQILIEMGHAPSRAFKEILDEIYDSQLEGRVKTNQDACNLASELFVKYTKSDH